MLDGRFDPAFHQAFVTRPRPEAEGAPPQRQGPIRLPLRRIMVSALTGGLSAWFARHPTRQGRR